MASSSISPGFPGPFFVAFFAAMSDSLPRGGTQSICSIEREFAEVGGC
jgi:hypothetical protein